jgi:hypothetical protein
MEHFLLKCTILQAVRYSVLDDIDTEFNIITGKTFYNLDSYLKIQILRLQDILSTHNLQFYWNSICVSCWYCFDIDQWMLFTWFVYFCIEEIHMSTMWWGRGKHGTLSSQMYHFTGCEIQCIRWHRYRVQ